MAWYMKSAGKGLLGTNKPFICLWLVMMLLLSSGSADGCDTQWSPNWQGFCLERGICAKTCREVGFDSGKCKKLSLCLCCRNCTDGWHDTGMELLLNYD